jgi:hypothetical protein
VPRRRYNGNGGEYIAGMGWVFGMNGGSASRNLEGNMKVGDRLEELGGNGRKILKRIIWKWDGVRGLDLTGSG